MKKLIIGVLLLTSFHVFGKTPKNLSSFIEKYCSDCHADSVDKGGLDFDKLKFDLQDPASFAKWELIYDRVMSGDMPPKKKKKRPSEKMLAGFDKWFTPRLIAAHKTQNETVLRRLNRHEYQNTLNDLFGTNVDIAEMLPEDGRSHEFENVGESLGMSMVQLQKYLSISETVIKAAIENQINPPAPKTKICKIQDNKGADRHVGKKWKLLDNGALVRFHSYSYPNGNMQNTAIKATGYYDIEITGWGYQTNKPMSFAVETLSYTSNVKTPKLGYYQFLPEKETTIKLSAYLEKGVMLKLEPYGINYKKPHMKPKEKFSIKTYKGPGFALKHVKITGPIRREFPSKGHKLIFDGIARQAIPSKSKKSPQKFKITSTSPEADAAKVLNRIGQKAFRTNDPDVKPYVDLFKSEMAQGEAFEPALITSISALLCSPDFLYLRETPGKLNDFALAARLSYFLNRTTPDDKLLDLARQGKLKSSTVLNSELKRLMKKPQFNRFINDFTDAWLNLRDMDFTEPDKTLYPEYAAFLRYSMPKETQLFFKELITSNLSVSNIVKSDFAILNNRLAELYEIPNVSGTHFRKVKLPADTVRGGIITHASVHKVSANGTNTSPVVRGIWMLERILGIHPPPPPPGVPGVEPDIRGAKTLREILDKHRSSPNCNSCHTKIDPLGFAMESFSPIGVYRENFRTKKGKGQRITPRVHGSWASYYVGPKVDATGAFSDGREFNSFNEFRNHLVQDKKLVAKTMAKKLLTFATGRKMGFSDRDEIERIVKVVSKNDYRLGDIFAEILKSKIFLNK